MAAMVEGLLTGIIARVDVRRAVVSRMAGIKAWENMLVWTDFEQGYADSGNGVQAWESVLKMQENMFTTWDQRYFQT